MKSKPYLNFLNRRVISLVVISIMATLFTIYVIFSSYAHIITSKKNELYYAVVKNNLKHSMILEMERLDNKLSLSEEIVNFLRIENEKTFDKPLNEIAVINESEYAIHPNGTLYSLNQEGASIYDALQNNSGTPDWDKIGRLRAMEASFVNFVDNFPVVEQIYFNSYDTMSIIYPGLPNSSDVFGNMVSSEDFIFYYWADQKHNPERTLKWTPVYADPAQAGWVLSCIVPIYQGDFLEGVSGIDVSVKNLTEDLTTFDLNLPYSVMILENENLITYYDQLGIFESKEIADYYYNEPIKNEVFLSDVHDIKTVLTSEQYAVFETKLSGASEPGQIMLFEEQLSDTDYVIFKSTLERLGWNYIFFVPKPSLIEPIENANKESNGYLLFANIMLLLLSIIIIFISAKMAKYMTTRIVNPIKELTAQSAKISISKNNFIELESEILEIEMLKDTLNNLQQEINVSLQQIIEAEKEKENINAKNQMLQDLSYMDLLTRIYNRRKIEEIMDEEISKNNNAVFSILLIDIDFFKKINDTFGHDVGDEVLVKLCQIMGTCLRATDALGRWGGEEFIIICKETTIAEAKKVAATLREQVECSVFIKNHPVTVSIGVAEFDKTRDDKYSIFKRADNLLYLAKKEGRNQVKVQEV